MEKNRWSGRAVLGVALVFSAALTACGGGGGGGDAAPSVEVFPIGVTATQSLTTNNSYSAIYQQGADTFTITDSNSPLSDGLFEGVLRKRSGGVVTFKQNGNTISSQSATVYFETNPVVIYGTTYDDGTVAVYTTRNPLPATAMRGQSGALVAGTFYTDATKTVAQYTGTATWALENGTSAANAWLCLTWVTRVFSTNAFYGSQSSCYLIDAVGAVQDYKFTLSDGSQTIHFQ